MNFTKSIKTIAVCAAALLLGASPARADLLLDESFDYTADAALPVDGKWKKVETSTNTILVKNKALTYKGYQDVAKGNALYIAPASDNKTVSYAVKAVEEAIKTDKSKVYVSFLMNVTAAPEKGKPWFISYAYPTTGGKWPNTNGTNGHIQLFKSDNEGKYKLGFGKGEGMTSCVEYDSELNLKETYLVVMCYTLNAGTSNDTFRVWVNPVAGATEPAADGEAAVNKSDISDQAGIQGVRVYQYGSSSHTSPTMYLDALRMATAWADLFPKGGDDPEPSAAITPSAESVQLNTPDGMAFQGQTLTGTFTVKGSGLTSDITLSCDNPAVTVEPATVSAEDANSAAVSVTVSYKATTADALAANITLASEGASDATVQVTAAVNPATDVPSFAFLIAKDDNESFNIYRYTGSMAKVSYVDTQNKNIYIQDMTAAIRINYGQAMIEYAQCPLKAGDKVKNIYLCRLDDAQGMAFIPWTSAIGDVTSEGNEVSPVEITFADLKQAGEENLNRLVKILDVTLSPSEGQVWGTQAVAASDEHGQANLSIFPASDLKDTPVPAAAKSVVGISTSKAGTAVRIRYASDIELVEEDAAIEITPTLNYGADEWLEVNKTYADYGTLHVKAVGLAVPVDIDVRGTDRALFSLSSAQIPAGSGEYDIKVTYAPTKVGKHTATIVFETQDNNTELNKTLTVRAQAWDPANPPSIVPDLTSISDFEATVGETQEQTLKYTVKNLLDYANVKVETPGAFIINSTTTPKYDGTYQLKITFKPLAEDTYFNKIIFTADKCEPVEVEIAGIALGDNPPEEKEGDELVFGGEALKSYLTDFSTAVENNKPLSLEGWKNVAALGTRAWWSYSVEGNQAAKVTAYDSKATVSEPVQMYLVSPCLDFKDADNRLLCFNVMGQFMTDDMYSDLGLYIVDAATARVNPKGAVYEYVEGLNFPCTKDENGEWARYVLDCDQWNLPDEFYCVFIFTSMRGKDESCVYYVDDFSWGRTDVPFIRSSHQMLEVKTVVGSPVESETVTVQGNNLSEPIALSMSGTGAKHFTLSATELPAEGGSFTVNYNPAEAAQHTAVVTLLSGNDARADILVAGAADPDALSDIAPDAWGDNVSVYDLEGRALMTDAAADDALRFMRQNRGKLFIVRTADAAYKYIAK